MISCPAPSRRADGRAVLSAAAGRRAGGAGALAHPAGDVAGRTGAGAAAASGRGLGARAGSAGGRAASGAAAAALPAGRAAAAQAVGDRDRDLAARSLRDLRASRAEAEQRCGRSTRRPMRPTTAAWCTPGCTISSAEHRHALAGRRGGTAAARDGAGAGRGGSARGAGRLVGAAAGADRRLGRGGSRRSGAACVRPVALVTEASGTLELARPGGLFRLIGRADRIERRREGGLAILDYKTGTPPSQKEVDAGLAPQLLLEAAMAAGRGVRRGDRRRGGGADLLAPDRRLPRRRVAHAVQGGRRQRSPRRWPRRARRCAR